jgi:hypothetical protein
VHQPQDWETVALQGASRFKEEWDANQGLSQPFSCYLKSTQRNKYRRIVAKLLSGMEGGCACKIEQLRN